jgi:hypothetical protein
VRYTNIRCVGCQLSFSPDLPSPEGAFKCPACGRSQTLSEQPSRNKDRVPPAMDQLQRVTQSKNERLKSLLEELLQHGPAFKLDGAIYVVTKVEDMP